MKRLMILGGGPLQMPAILTAKRLGLDVFVADMNREAVAFAEHGVKPLEISTTDTAAISRAAREFQIDGIITAASDVPIPTVAAVCREMNLCGVTPRTALLATNKAEMRNCLKECGVPIPGYVVVKSPDELKEAASCFAGKVVVKASDNSGNRGISMVESTTNKIAMEAAYNYARQNTRDGRVLIEDYMEGEEFSVEGISVGGVYHAIQVTDKITMGSPYFVEMGHTQPTAQPKEIADAIIHVAARAAGAIGITDGPSHTEIKLTPDGPKIVELGARLGGGCITSHLVPLSTGIDITEATIKIALGEVPDLAAKCNKAAAIRFFDSHRGVLSAIYGVEEALQSEGVKEVSLFKAVGSKIGDLKTGLDRVGYVIAQGDTRSEAVDNCERALKKIALEIE